jgi:PKD domain.
VIWGVVEALDPVQSHQSQEPQPPGDQPPEQGAPEAGTISGPDEIQAGTQANFTYQGGPDDIAAYNWNVSPSNIAQTNQRGSTLEVEFDSGGRDAVISASATTYDDRTTPTSQKTVTILGSGSGGTGGGETPPSDISISGPENTFVNSLERWQAEAPSGVNTAELEWDMDDGTTFSGVSVTHSYSEERPYLITLSYQGQEVDDLMVDVAEEPVASGGIEGLDALNEGQRYTFTYEDQGDYGVSTQVYWTFGDGENDVGQEVQHTYDDTGDYQMRAEVRELGGAGTVTLEEDVMYVTVQEPVRGGLSAGGVPSMSEAAQQQKREY